MESNELEKSLKQLRGELRTTRIFCVISSLLTACLLAGGIFLYTQIQPALAFLQDVRPVMEQLAALDIKGVNDVLEQVNNTLGSIDWQQVDSALGSIDWQEVSDSLSKLDVEAINSTIEGLDMEGISEAIDNLNGAADVIEGLGERLSSITSLFGN